jgi:hypothetical protein
MASLFGYDNYFVDRRTCQLVSMTSKRELDDIALRQFWRIRRQSQAFRPLHADGRNVPQQSVSEFQSFKNDSASASNASVSKASWMP